MTLHNGILSRRSILRGLGVSVCLPMLDAIQCSGRAMAASTAAGTAVAPPKRMAFLFVPNGVHLPDWTPKSEGYGFELPYILQPLEALRDDFCVLTGLAHDKGRANGDGPGDHARSASVFLTGAQPRKTDGANIRSGISVDQVAAQAIGSQTRFASLELGIERGQNAGNCDSGYSCAYSSNISWGGEATPLGKEVNPRSVFERLFAGGTPTQVDESQQRRMYLRKSVLDFVAEDARRLQHALGHNDRRKLDEYLTGVRQIEQRIERAEQATAADLGDVEVDYPVPSGIPAEYRDHVRLMCDMIVLAFQTDSTRVATMMLANAGSNRPYREIGVPDEHHDLSHHGGDAAKHAKIRKINHFHIEQLAYLLMRLKSIPEGEGTLLDHTMLCYGSGLGDGDRHNHDNLPVLLAGRGGGAIDPGRHIRYPDETPMCNLFVSMLESMGVPVDSHGDSTGSLRGLKVS